MPNPQDPNDGLLHHEHSPNAELIATPARIEEAASQSHHGVVRERGPKIGREEEAKLALEHTRISRATAWLLTLAFLATIFSVPILGHFVEIRRNLAERKAQIARGETADGPIAPRFYDFLGELPTWGQIREAKTPQQAWSLVPSADSFKKHEDLLQDDSLVVEWTLPRVQNFLFHAGVGNEQAYIGRKIGGRQWLHYRPDVDYVTSPGFLDPALLKMKARAGESDNATQPDPIRAIADFAQQLKARGIELVVMPTPVKAMAQPETLSNRFRFGEQILQNPSYPAFLATMQREKITVFDASPLILNEMRRTKRAQYLEADTHWTPAAMQFVARELARFLEKTAQLSPRENGSFSAQEKSVENLGDIAQMLKLPAWQTVLTPQAVTIRQITDFEGENWYPDRQAAILLLGDSFSNIYSLEGMNWGESAGLGEQLSYELQRPVDTITNNAGGSHVTRERLVKELAQGKPRLARKRVVIWQFAMRDLLIGDWKILKLPEE